MSKILLVDGSHLARRNYHSQQLSTSDGMATGLIYGVINSLTSLYSEIQYDFCVIAWDTRTSSAWRKEIYPLYKGNRTAPEESFLDQLEMVKALLNAIGICQFEKADAEADDIIGFLAKEGFSGQDHDIIILSGDEDFWALVDDDVQVYSPTKGWIFPGEDGMIEKAISKTKSFRLRPDQMVDFKCLVGDSSDNIPGAVGFGPGAAATFFQYNEGIKNLLDGTVNLAGLTSRATQGLLEALPVLQTFHDIITISTERGRVDDLAVPLPNKEKVKKLFELFEFNSFKVLGDTIFNIGGNDAGVTLNIRS